MSWPPIMKNPSEDLKRILGNSNMDNRTVRKRLISYGYVGDEDFVLTDELIARVTKAPAKKANSFRRYRARCPYAKDL